MPRLQKAFPAAPAGNQLAFCEGLCRCAEQLTADGKSKTAIAIYDSLRQSPVAHQVRTAALRGAVLARQKEGLPLLIESLESADYAVFAAAARTALEMPGEPVTQALAAELAKPSADRQILLTQVLAKRGDAAGLPALLTAAKTGTQPVRAAAIRAMAELGNGAAVPALLELMSASDREVSQSAQEALAALINPMFQRVAAERGFASPALFATIAEQGGVRGNPEVPADVQRRFPTAHDVDIATHVRMQAAFQRHVHAAVSKTINLRREASAAEVKAAYQLAYELGCKGITVYRDGSREGQVLVTGARGSVVNAAPSCPECGSVLVVQTHCRLCRHCGWSVGG